MMRVMMDFNKTILLLPKHWAVWVGLLVIANFIAPLFFINLPEGQVVLGAGMIAIVIQMVIFARLGFVRLLGLGHSPWIALVPWLWVRLDAAGLEGPLGYWMAAVIVLDCASLIIDVVDVVRFLRGERAPTVSLAGSQGG